MSLLVMATLAAASAPSNSHIAADANAIQADVEFLADDLLEGRGTNERGFDIAALYVASRYRALGLEPAGDDGSYFQTMQYRAAKTIEQSVTINGKKLDEIAVLGNVLNQNIAIDAPLVFLGYGIEAGRFGHGAFGNVDVSGKIVVVFVNDPALPEETHGDIVAHLYASRRASAGKHGALGIIEIRPDYQHDYYAKTQSALGWVDDEGRSNALPGSLKVVMTTNDEGARTLIHGAGHDFDALRAVADTGGALASFELGHSISINAKSQWREFSEVNVLGRLPGVVPEMQGQHVVLTAHLDHVGKIDAIPEDNIFNGALDNAAGVASMLDVARQLADGGEKPARSIIFAALGVEEEGLMGSAYLAMNPTVPLYGIVANLNLDLPVPLFDFDAVVGHGSAHSSLSEVIASEGAGLGIHLVPDPRPDAEHFVRSDHYPFILRGIPSVMISTQPNAVDQAIYDDFFDNHLHQPTDDLALPINWDALALYAELNARVARRIASDEMPPLWFEENFLGHQFAQDSPKAKRRIGTNKEKPLP